MKRFWDAAAVAPAPDGYAILLDGKPMRVPGGPELRVASATLAQAIAAEWHAAGGVKGGEMSMADVPLTRLAGTAQERIAPDPAPVADALAKYAETDLLCYRAEYPVSLVVRQAREWQPWLDWLEQHYGAKLHATAGVAHVSQPPQALDTVRDALRARPPPILAALGIAVPALGSLVLGLALADGAVDATRAYELANLDELYQAEHWGEDQWAARRRGDLADDIALASRFLELAQSP